MPKYIRCVFPNSRREYTYIDPDGTAEVGHMVDVHTATGIRSIEVVGTSDEPYNDVPAHVTLKAIMGLTPVAHQENL